jgi:hypothetical protein
VPSGVDASTGETAGAAVAAHATATFHAAKPGLWIEPGRSCAGRVSVLDIGIPPGAPASAEIALISDEVLELIPRRGAHSTKFTSGRVLVAGGSPGLTGAPCLAALAAARAGAGYVTVCVPQSLSLVFESRLLEAMTIALPDEDAGRCVRCWRRQRPRAAARSCSVQASAEVTVPRRSRARCSRRCRWRSCSTPTA